jgi:SagB-type dehydrogenase family enzyme
VIMNRRAIRHDLSYLVSAGLLLLATIAAITGWISDRWDLNDFVYHRYAGYAMAALTLIHVGLHGRRLVAYAHWRLGKPSRQRRSATEERQTRSFPTLKEVFRLPLSRRGFLGLMLGGVGGFAVARSLRIQPDIPYGSDVGMVYHEWSKPKLLSLLGTLADWGRQPAQYKTYAGANSIALPPPGDYRGLATEEAIQRRRSVRGYSGQPMTLDEFSRLLYYTDGINTERRGRRLRAAPSAGALYPIEVYPVVHRVEGLEPGLYHYAVRDHALELLRAGNLQGEINRHGLMQGFLGEANLVLVLTAIFQRLRWKYESRTYRYALLEAGHLGQNVYLVATSMGMGACAVGSFADDGLNNMLEVDGQHEAAVYMLAVGKV